MRKLLVPTDFSDNALNALRYALELFKYEICEFHIMHAYQDDIYADKGLMTGETLDEVTRIISERSQLELEDIIKQINQVSPNQRHS